jgi:hypothetical protein
VPGANFAVLRLSHSSLLACRPSPRALLQDQNDIASQLSHVPIYLAGCNTLLVLFGESYLSRLWSVATTGGRASARARARERVRVRE